MNANSAVGISISLQNGIPKDIGLGLTAATTVATFTAINDLFGLGMSNLEIIKACMSSDRISGLEGDHVGAAAFAFTPTTIAALGPHNGMIGCVIQGVGDMVTVTVDPSVPHGLIKISLIKGLEHHKLSFNPIFNCVAIAADSFMSMMNVNSAVGISISIQKGIPIDMGQGSTSATTVATFAALNDLFGLGMSNLDIVKAFMS
ncbi:homoserine kinase-like [Magnolia sinica]|uniref:homoserine kinase-like n=1 Tax=Magnolia sinica TaxID=86752 RepID=UPI002659C97B|nr:homoserine kinase-like [Magnolia sinica]